MTTSRLGEEAFFQVLFNDDFWKGVKKYMFAKAPNIKSSNFYNYKDLGLAAKYGYFGLIKERPDLRRIHINPISIAAVYGHLEILKYFHDNKIGKCSKITMDIAAGRGFLEVVKFLHYNTTEGCTTIAMNSAATYGHIKIVKFLHYNRKEGCTTAAIDEAAENGHLEVVEFLLLNRKEGYTMNAINKSIVNGHSEISYLLAEMYCRAKIR